MANTYRTARSKVVEALVKKIKGIDGRFPFNSNIFTNCHINKKCKISIEYVNIQWQLADFHKSINPYRPSQVSLGIGPAAFNFLLRNKIHTAIYIYICI